MIQIRCYNVIFSLECSSKEDYEKICYLGKRMARERVLMTDLFKWCNAQKIPYKTRYIYRSDFPLKANVWNLYTYIRGWITNQYNLRKI